MTHAISASAVRSGSFHLRRRSNPLPALEHTSRIVAGVAICERTNVGTMFDTRVEAAFAAAVQRHGVRLEGVEGPAG